MKQIFELIGRPSPQIKELRLLYENNDNVGVYKIYSKWEGAPELDGYCRILYSENDKIDGLDFDGGPMIYRGFSLDKHNKIIDIYKDKNTKEFLVKVKSDEKGEILL